MAMRDAHRAVRDERARVGQRLPLTPPASGTSAPRSTRSLCASGRVVPIAERQAVCASMQHSGRRIRTLTRVARTPSRHRAVGLRFHHRGSGSVIVSPVGSRCGATGVRAPASVVARASSTSQGGPNDTAIGRPSSSPVHAWRRPAALAVAVLAGGCGGSDEPSPKARAASEPAVLLRTSSCRAGGSRSGATSTRRRHTERSSPSIPMGAMRGSSPIRPAGMWTTIPTGRPTASGSPLSAVRRASRARCSRSTPTAAARRKVKARCELQRVCDLAYPAWTPDGRLLVTLAQGRERPEPAMTGETGSSSPPSSCSTSTPAASGRSSSAATGPATPTHRRSRPTAAPSSIAAGTRGAASRPTARRSSP